MKTYKHLYSQVCAFENLYSAFLRARKGKRSRPDVAAFEDRLEIELIQLQDELLDKSYQPGPYRHFTLYEGKPRRISAAPFRDRVVHHALCGVIEPIWETRFIHDNYACRRGKGTHAAMDRCTAFARRYRYVLQCDVVQFFPNVDHTILHDLLARRIADGQVMRLVDKIITSGTGIHAPEPHWFPGDDLLTPARPTGLPIGNQTSQFWANVYLHEVDKFVKQTLRCGAYLRYCDDSLLFADDKPTLHAWRAAIEGFMAGLRLRLHKRKTVVYPVKNGIPFLGFLVFAGHRRLQQANGLRFQRRLKRMLDDYARGRIDGPKMHERVRSWAAHAAHGDTWGLRASIFQNHPIPPARSRE